MNELRRPPLTAKPELTVPSVIYRWDLDKTYLRTEFDTFICHWSAPHSRTPKTSEPSRCCDATSCELRKSSVGRARRFVSYPDRRGRCAKC